MGASSEPIRVAVNLTWLDPGRVGGSEEYLTRQLRGLDATVVAPTLFCSDAFVAAHRDLTTTLPTRTMPSATTRTGRPGRIIGEHTWLALRSRGTQVVHHGGGTTPAIGPTPIVLTVHDLQYLVHPEYFSVARRRYLDFVVPRSVDRADVVAVPTATVREHVVEAFGAAAERVVVVPHGVPDPPPVSPQDVHRARERLGLGDSPFVVYPAISHPHKRHGVLVDMMNDLDDGTRLVLVGGVGADEQRLHAAIDASPHADRIVRAGRVSSTDRDALLVGADALVFPSAFEGFGAPLVEAMAVGTPVVCSSADAVREVVGDAAVVVDHLASDAWAAGVREARARHDELVEAGHRRRAEFTIRHAGEAITAAYRLAVGR